MIGKLLQSKQANGRPSVAQSTGESLEYRRLLQQWDQLLIQDGLLWRIFAQPQESASWKQLVVPQKLCTDILKHLHEGITGGHLGQDKTLHKLKEHCITGLATTMTLETGVKPVEHVQKGNHHQQVGEH